MKDYDICKDINDYYFNSYAPLSLRTPAFFDEFSSEDDAIKEIKKLTDDNYLDQAVALAEKYMQSFPPHTQHAFLAMQIFAMWKQGKLPNDELIAYFDGLEEILPNDVVPNFNKAVLHARNKQFNKAMKELKTAREKSDGDVRSLALQFWIYYFSRDEKWRSLYKLLVENKVLPPEIQKMINVVDSINQKTVTADYLSGDRSNPKEANKKLFDKFPALVMRKEPTEENILMVAAESNYLKEYVITLLLSNLEISPRNYGVHVHVYNPMGVDIELLEQYNKKYPELKLSYSYEKGSFTVNSETAAYYASMRFARAYQILSDISAIKKIAVVDADALVRANPFERKDLGDITLTGGPPVAPDWDQFAGGFLSFSKTPEAEQAFAYFTNILLKNFAQRLEFWFIDQIAIYDTYRNFSKSAKISRISADDIFGKDMQHTQGSTFWTYTNEHKKRDNLMNHERRRLFEKYGIALDWNHLAAGKYGNIVANINDEYIGRQLLRNGSWCDHEIRILKRMIEFGDTVLEVGSNIGSHTLPLAKAVGSKGRLYAIEPQRILFQTMCAQLAMNSIQNVYALNIAVGEQEGQLNVTELDPAIIQNFGGYQPKAMKGETIVELKTIDSLKLGACKLIKMDIEGMELEALKGGVETLREFEPILFFESHGEGVHVISNFLKDFGYTVYDFAIPNDPMFLAVTAKYGEFPGVFNIRPLA